MYWDGTRWINQRHGPAKVDSRRRKRDWIATVIMLLGVAAIAIPLLVANARSERMTLSPLSGAPGATVTVHLAGLSPGSRVQLAWDGHSRGMPSGRASNVGDLVVDFIVPKVTNGPHQVSALSGRSGGSTGINRGSHFLVAGFVMLTSTFSVDSQAAAAPPSTGAASSTPSSSAPSATPVATPSASPSFDLPRPSSTPSPMPSPTPLPTPVPVISPPAPPPTTPAPAPLPTPIAAGGPAMPGGAIWADEFNGLGLDGSRWGWDMAMVGTGDNMNRYAMFSTDPRLLEVSSGTLKLKALRELDGSWIQSYISTRDRYMQQYGIFRASMKIPSGHALWPAFWMLDPTQYDEMDIIEAYPQPGDPTYTFCMHYLGGAPCASMGLPADHATAFHVYEMEWRPGVAIGRIDGVEVARHAIPEMRPQFMLLQMAVGVWFKDLAPDATTPTNPVLEVDWVGTWP